MEFAYLKLAQNSLFFNNYIDPDCNENFKTYIYFVVLEIFICF